MDRTGLMALIHDLYEIDVLNRRALHERFASSNATFKGYRDLVRAAVFPDPLGRQPIRLREAAATIREYPLATGNLTGTVDLMLDFVEAGTAQGSFSRGPTRSSGAASRCPRSTPSGTSTSPSRTQWAGWTTTSTNSGC